MVKTAEKLVPAVNVFLELLGGCSKQLATKSAGPTTSKCVRAQGAHSSFKVFEIQRENFELFFQGFNIHGGLLYQD